jgi:GT2 family glycosyltransferase
MHRSGTSMVAKLLHLSGLYLGPKEDLLPATPDNLDGHWENTHFVALNDAILNALGGGWDRPPSLPNGWSRGNTDSASTPQRLLPFKERALALLEKFRDHDAWGWKDPRTSLTLPFWQSLLPCLKVVICLRNPLEVALSLRRRGGSSYALSLDLWKTYSERIMRDVPSDRRIITHYDRYFLDPEPELRRVLAFLDIPASEESIRQCCSAAKSELRHGRFTTAHLIHADVSAEVLHLYLQMQEEAEWSDGDAARRPKQQAIIEPPVDAEGPQLDTSALDLASLRRDERDLRRALAARDGSIQQLLQQLTQQQQTSRHEIADLRIALTKQHEIAELRMAVTTQLEMVETLHQISWAALRQLAPNVHKHLSYLQMVRRIRAAVRQAVPPDATVIIVSKGDDNLLQLDDRIAWHFPQTGDGAYAGYNPANSTAAIAHLEALRAMGGQFLLFPQSALWWLEHYSEFKQHLEKRYRLIVSNQDTCLIYALRDSAGPQPVSWRAEVDEAITEFERRFGAPPAILDWNTGLDLAAAWPQQTVFPGPKEETLLSYLDQSIDMVAVSSANAASVAEARRVAIAATILVETKQAGENGQSLAIEWQRDGGEAQLPSISIMIPCYNCLAHTEGCLLTLRETLPRCFRGEFILIDDASTDETSARLQQLAESDIRLKILRNTENIGFLNSSNRGAEIAMGDILIFLNNDTVLLPGWLPPLLEIFRTHADAGAVGGRLLFPDGRLQEAGGVIFADGSAAKFGYGDYEIDTPLYHYVRPVAYCSGALLATKRSLFSELGGFDTRFCPGYYEDVDYCFRVRQKGYRVFYHPHSAIVHFEGAAAGTDLSAGPKQFQVVNQSKFAQKWASTLRHYPRRPERLDIAALHALATSNDWEGDGEQ